MRLEQEIAQMLKIDIETALRVLDIMERTDFDFSQASTAMLKRAAREAFKEIAH